MGVDVIVCAHPQERQAAVAALITGLVRRFGAKHVVHDIAPSQFQVAMERANTLVLLIGPRLLAGLSASTEAAKGVSNAAKIDPPEAYIRHTIDAAWSERKLIIPVLTDGLAMPSGASLPSDLRFLARLNAFALSGEDDDTHVRTIAHQIGLQFGGRRARVAVIWGSAISVLWPLVALVAMIFLLGRGPDGAYFLYYFGLSRALALLFAPLAALTLFVCCRALVEQLWGLLIILLVCSGLLLADAGQLSAGNFGALTLVLVISGLLGLVVAIAMYGIGSARVVWASGYDTARRRKPRSGRTPPASIGTLYFLSYRRDDTGDVCDELYNHLARGMNKWRAFRDLNSILAGADFATVLERALDGCLAVIVLIGPQWLSITDASGKRRIEDPQDYVHMETATALRKEKIVIPLLVKGTSMPTVDELPPDLAPLAALPPLRVADLTLEYLGLMLQLRKRLQLPPLRAQVSAITAAFVFVGAIFWGLLHPGASGLFARRLLVGCTPFGPVPGCMAYDAVEQRVLVGLLLLAIVLLMYAWAAGVVNAIGTRRWRSAGVLVAPILLLAIGCWILVFVPADPMAAFAVGVVTVDWLGFVGLLLAFFGMVGGFVVVSFYAMGSRWPRLESPAQAAR